jgi:uncharacterized protein YecT (DUF1311 family)
MKLAGCAIALLGGLSLGLIGGLGGLNRGLAAEPAPAAELPGVSRPYCPDQSQQGLNRCAAVWLQSAEHLQQLVYDDLRQQLDLAQRVQLAVAQEHWLDFQTAQCRMESEPFTGGSIYSLIYGGCMAQLTNDRTGDLQRWGPGLGAGPGADLSPTEADAALQAAIDDGLPANGLAAQAQWEAYRTLHCVFEAAYWLESSGQYEQCASRLTQIRAARLQQLGDGDR